MSPATDRQPGGTLDSGVVAGRYRDSIYRYILRLVREPERADDLTQETFLRVHQRIDSLRDDAALESWLYRIATNVAYDGFRQRGRRGTMLPLIEADAARSAVGDEMALRPDLLLEQSEMSDCVMDLLTRLPDSQREVMLLHDLQGFTGPRIADQLGISLDNVKIRLHRARVRLRAALADECDFSRDERGVLICEPKRGKPEP